MFYLNKYLTKPYNIWCNIKFNFEVVYLNAYIALDKTFAQKLRLDSFNIRL